MKKSKRKVLIPVYPTENVFEFEDISSSLKKYKIPTERPVRIYCDGVYDLFHYGHANSLEQAKNLFPNVHLLVGVTADKITNELKGSTVFNEVERAESLRHCRHVDEVITNAPWIITDEFLEKHKIDYVAHDESPYKFNNIDDIYKHLKEKNMFIPIKRTKGISTSGIITKIVRDYDKYVRRNLERGATAKELNISFLQFNKFKMAKQFKNLMKNVDFQSRLDEIRMELTIATKFWERVSNELIVSFLAKFNRVSQRNRQFNIIDKILEFVKSKTR